MVRPFLSSVAWSEAASAPSGETENKIRWTAKRPCRPWLGAALSMASSAGNSIDDALAVDLKVEPVLPQVCGGWRSRFQFSSGASTGRTASPLSQFWRVGLTNGKSGLVHLAARRLLRKAGFYARRHPNRHKGQRQPACASAT